MATYQYKGAGYGIPDGSAGKCRYQRKIDAAELVAAGADSGLALVAAPNTGVALKSTGFDVNDILEVFWVPKGTVVRGIGIYLVTAEGGAATIDVGVASNTETNEGTNVDTWIDGFDINGTPGTLAGTGSASVASDDDFMGEVIFKTDGSIDITFLTGAVDNAVFVIWADTYFIDPELLGF
jgi:hypothetical protein